jgi:hypothetical protein
MRPVQRLGLGLAVLTVAAVSGAGSASGAAAPKVACCDTHGSISLINPAANQLIGTAHVAGSPVDMIVSPSGESAFVEVAGKNGERIVKIASRPAAITPVRLSFSPQGWAMAPGGRRLYLARALRVGRHGQLIPGSIVPVTTATAKPQRPITIRTSLPSPGGPMVVSPDGKVLYYSAGFPDAVVPVDLATRHAGDPVRVGSASFQIAQLMFSRDGKRLYALSLNGVNSRLTEIVAATRRVVGTVAIRGFPDDMAITPGGGEVYVTSDRSRVTAIRTGRLTVIKTITVAGAAAVAVAPDGRTAYVTGAVVDTGAGQLTAISTRTNTAAPPITVGPDPANGFAITPDGQWAYIFDLNDTVVPVNLNTNTAGVPIVSAPQPPAGASAGVGGIGFTPAGKLLYVIDLTT